MSQIDTKAVAKAVAALDAAYADLKKARKDYETVKGLNGQSGYCVTVNGVRVDVAVMDSRTYQAGLIRGREMIHLGALKALQGAIRYYEQRVAECEAELKANSHGAGVSDA
ncbi:hypothetical protein [Stenotrophomonas acidaminiphila]|uniref:hypothetical protein n=1 Tax=Stenotrophomonas acidaminiphila TaxID=128780 RepID=UPI0028AA2705|nr:hypothetical protein [Stenotrophomonas acidaminiphila]